MQVEIGKALDDPEVRVKRANLGCEPFKGTSEQWALIVKESGATVD